MNTTIVSTLLLAYLLVPGMSQAQAPENTAPAADSTAELAAAAAAEYARLQRPAPKSAGSDAEAKEQATPAAEGNRSQRTVTRLQTRQLAAERRRVRDSYRKQRLALVADESTLSPVTAESTGTSGGK